MLLPMLLALLAGSPAAASNSRPERLAPPLRPATATVMRDQVRSLEGKVVMVNAWATWCIPCREEMPDLLKLRRELRDRGFELLLVSTDFDESLPDARRFLGGLGVDFATWQKKQKDQEFIRGLDPSWSGALPFTVIFDTRGERSTSWEGRLSHDEMRGKILALLPPAGEIP